MSWLMSLLVAGAVFISGTDVTVENYNNTQSINNKSTTKVKVADETERFEKTYPFSPDGKIEVSNINGSITVEAWDNPQIYLEAVKIADSKERLGDVDIEIDAGQTNFAVKTNYKSWKNSGRDKNQKYGKLEVVFRLKVPRTAVLDEIETVNGSVTVSDMTKYTEVSAVNGSVNARNLRGTAKLSTVNGGVTVDFEQLENDSIISLGTVNGSVNLRLPSATNATVRADTVNGSINNEFGLPVRKGKWVGRDLYGQIGSGDVKIKLNSVNGSLNINRKNDGGTPNPVINLLPKKDTDDFDDSFEMQFEFNVGKFNKDIEKAMKETQKALAVSKKEMNKASKVAEVEVAKEMARVAPEIARLSAEQFRIATESIDREKLEKDLEAARLTQTAELAKLADSIRLSRSPYIVEKTATLEVEGTPQIKIDSENCSVYVRGWDKPEVKYSITRIVRNRNREEPKVSVTHNKTKTEKNEKNSLVEIKVVNEDSGAAEISGSRSNMVRLEVFVPKKSDLQIHTDREIRLEGVSGELKLIGGDDSINVRDSDGELQVRSVDGMVRVIGFNGAVWTETADGETLLEGNFRKIYASSEDGNITVTLPKDADARVYSNTKTKLEGFESNCPEEKKGYWVLGKGNAKFDFNVQNEGRVLIRNQDSIITN